MKFFLLLLTFFSFHNYAQDAAKDFTVPIEAVVSNSPAQITLNWTENSASGTSYDIYRKSPGETGWGSSIGSVSVGTTVFTDINVNVGDSYEYLVQKVTGNSLYS